MSQKCAGTRRSEKWERPLIRGNSSPDWKEMCIRDRTIAFCANILMAQDRVTGGVCDLMAAPIKKSTLALSYYIANMIATGIVCFAAAAVGFLYLSVVGWYFTVTDVLLILLDVLLCVLFGTALAALVENFISCLLYTSRCV